MPVSVLLITVGRTATVSPQSWDASVLARELSFRRQCLRFTVVSIAPAAIIETFVQDTCDFPAGIVTHFSGVHYGQWKQNTITC